MLGKILAASLTPSIGGSGGVFAPSLFTGAMGGMAFGVIVQHLFGPIVSSPAIFRVVAMGGAFGATAQAPLTAIASVVEMTGDFTLIVPVMLAVGIATALSKRLSYKSIYTAKLLRRGIDIERPKPGNVRQMLTVSDVMLPVLLANGAVRFVSEKGALPGAGMDLENLARVAGPVTETRQPEILFSDDTLDQALRQLVLYGRSGLPVLSPDGEHLRAWITRQRVLRALADSMSSSTKEAEQGRLAS
jgi:CIC family chloride channel protein